MPHSPSVSDVSPSVDDKDTTKKMVKRRGRPSESLNEFMKVLIRAGGCFDPSPRKRGRPTECFDYLYEKTRLSGNVLPVKRGRPSKDLPVVVPPSKKKKKAQMMMMRKEYPLVDERNSIPNANKFTNHEQFN